ncbi:hypothetical protein D3C86_1838390 [compost metagenome]
MMSPSTERMLALFSSICSCDSMMSVAIVKISKRTKTMPTPMRPADPADLWPFVVSSLRLDATSQPQ